MKNEEKLARRVREELGRELAFLDGRPSLQHRILREMKGERVVKRKMSFGVILALVIALLCAAASAWTLSRQYFAEVAQLHFDSGYYDDWGWPEKQAMVDILKSHELITAEEAAAMTDEAAVDAYMIGRYGVNGRSDTIGLWAILDKELGEISTWTLEQKAWYSEMLIDIGLLTSESDDAIHALPDTEDVQPEAAVAIAKQAVIDAYGLAQNELDEYQVDISFETHASDWERRKLRYYISFWREDGGYYSCGVTRDGRIVDSSIDPDAMSPVEERLWKTTFANENDLEAIGLFQEYAAEHVDPDRFVFDMWPLEDKKAVTDLLRPVILENMAENPDYADLTRMFWATHIYGLPDDRALPEGDAIALAAKSVQAEYGLTDAQLQKLDRIGLFYEVTDPDAPLWKINLRMSSREDETTYGMDFDDRYRVVIGAYSGEVLAVHLITGYENTPEGIALEN